jgi:hypothetical protein
MTAERVQRLSLSWRKAQRSTWNGACVEVAARNGFVVIRDSKNPEGPVLCYLSGEWKNFIIRTKRRNSVLGSF